MNSAAYEVIKDAILNKKNISADYKGYIRIMTPHTLGHKNGREKCLLYQFEGESSSARTFPKNSPDNWRCVFVDELRNIKIIGGELHTYNKHTQRQTCADRVEVEIEL